MGHSSIVSKAALPSAELNLGGTATTEKVFTLSGSTTAACVLPLINLEALASSTGKRMSVLKLVAAGRVTGGGTTNFTVKLYFGTSITTASDSLMMTGATVAVNSVSGTFAIDATLTIDNVSGKIDGFFANVVSGSTRTYTAAAIIGANASSITTPALSFTTTTAQGFVMSGTFSSGFAGNVAYLDVFDYEVIG